jgi:HEAT repeat protein
MADQHEAAEILIKVMNGSSYATAIRSAAAEGLGYAGGELARKELVTILIGKSNATDVRAAAARALAHAARV